MTVPASSRMTAPTGTSSGRPGLGWPAAAGGPARAASASASRIAGSKEAVYPVTDAKRDIERALHRLAEPEPFGDVGHGVLRVEVEVGRDRAEFHLVEAEVREDGQVARREHLVELVVGGHRDVQGLEHLAGQRIVRRRGEVGQEQRHVLAEDPDRHEEVVAHAGEADGAAHARLPAQRLDEPSRSAVTAVGRTSASHWSSSR